jgi:hypothetical protein
MWPVALLPSRGDCPKLRGSVYRWPVRNNRYLGADTGIVWVLDPDSIAVNVYQKQGVFRTLTADDLIDAPELLPGFSIPVRTLFE